MRRFSHSPLVRWSLRYSHKDTWREGRLRCYKADEDLMLLPVATPGKTVISLHTGLTGSLYRPFQSILSTHRYFNLAELVLCSDTVPRSMPRGSAPRIHILAA